MSEKSTRELELEARLAEFEEEASSSHVSEEDLYVLESKIMDALEAHRQHSGEQLLSAVETLDGGILDLILNLGGMAGGVGAGGVLAYLLTHLGKISTVFTAGEQIKKHNGTIAQKCESIDQRVNKLDNIESKLDNIIDEIRRGKESEARDDIIQQLADILGRAKSTRRTR